MTDDYRKVIKSSLKLKSTTEKKTIKRKITSTIADPIPVIEKTEAEKSFEEAQRKKPRQIKSHKSRVEELNKRLSKLTEHYDIPKVGPG